VSLPVIDPAGNRAPTSPAQSPPADPPDGETEADVLLPVPVVCVPSGVTGSTPAKQAAPIARPDDATASVPAIASEDAAGAGSPQTGDGLEVAQGARVEVSQAGAPAVGVGPHEAIGSVHLDLVLSSRRREQRLGERLRSLLWSQVIFGL
jgi:hypothetical protein